MESFFGFRGWSACHHPHHHHHHHYLHQFCSIHNHHHHTHRYHHHHCKCNRHSFVCHKHNNSNNKNALQKDFNFQANVCNETSPSFNQGLQDLEEHSELLEDEENNDPVFVLTDEWRDFFTKSEARRKLEK